MNMANHFPKMLKRGRATRRPANWILPHLLRSSSERGACSQHQDEPGAENISGGQRRGLRNTAGFDLLGFAKHQGIDGHICLDVSRTSNVYFDRPLGSKRCSLNEEEHTLIDPP
jgi:hypothetical protein